MKQSNVTKVRKLAKVVNRLCAKKGVIVNISGDTAYSTGGLINIPIGDFDDPSYMVLINGYIDHETGHEAHTDHSYMKKSINAYGNLGGSFWNALEDARMEKAQANLYPGCKINLENLWSLCIDRNTIPAPCAQEEVIHTIFSFVLSYARQSVCGYTNNYVAQGRELLINAFDEEFVSELSAIIDELRFSRSSKGPFDLMVRIMELLKSKSEEDNDESDDDNDDSSTDDDSDESESDSDDDSSANGDSDSDGGESDSDDESGTPADSNENTEAGDSPDTENQPTQSSDEGGDKGGEKYRQQLKESLKEGTDTVEDYHKDVEGLMTEQAQASDVPEMPEFDLKFLENYQPRESLRPTEWKGLSNQFARTLSKVLIDSSDSLTLSAVTGRNIIRRKLAHIPAGETNVFEYKTSKEAKSSAVSVLVDASGSMSHSNMLQANITAIALSKAMSRLKINNEVTYFGVNYGRAVEDNRLHVAKKFDGKLREANFAVHPNGSTPTSDALFYSMSRLLGQQSENKIVFIITDGHPDCRHNLEQVANLALSAGIKLIPIGLNTRTVFGFKESVYAKNAQEVNNALRNAIKTKMF